MESANRTEQERVALDRRFVAYAPFAATEELRPIRLHRGRGGVALTMKPARVRAWLDGWRRAEDHPLRPRVLASDEGAVVVEPFSGPVDPCELLTELASSLRTVAGTRRELLAELSPEVDVARALAKQLPRRRVDRYLDQRVQLRVRIGIGFGGVLSPWWRGTERGPVTLRCERVRTDGWLALDLAALAVDRAVDHSVDPEAFELATIAILLREATLGHEEGLARRAAALVPPLGVPERVRVRIEGHPCIEGLWEAAGAEVSARRGRWLLQNVDGTWIAGVRTAVRVDPELRRGRRPPRREPLDVRRRRLFSRWDAGIEVDDEGLVGLTPEALAHRISEGARGVVIDGTCGVGGLTIALARQPDVARVVAVDIDEARLSMARHNAALYGVGDRIEWVRGDVAEVVRERSADLLVLDPPWGGRDYDRERVGLDDLGMDVRAVLERWSGPVRLKLPRSFDPRTLPGRWALELLLDSRQIPKLLLATRA